MDQPRENKMAEDEERQCLNCRHWIENKHSGDLGECRRYPPAVVGPVDNSGQDNPEHIHKRTFWPVVSYVSICGEHAE